MGGAQARNAITWPNLEANSAHLISLLCRCLHKQRIPEEARELLSRELTHEFGGCSDSTLLAYLDGTQTVNPIARILARFFGTSVCLWKRLAKQWDERSENGQQTGNQSLPVPHWSSE